MSFPSFTKDFSNLSTFEKMGISYLGLAADVDGTVSSAKKQMQSVQLPTYPIDIFRKTYLEMAKALFSPLYKEDPTPGFGFSALERRCRGTLEMYFVDKHLSSGISSEFMTEVLKRIEDAVNKKLRAGREEGCGDSDLFYSDTIQSFGKYGDTFVTNFREVNIEVSFMLRITERLRIQEEVKLYKELGLPNLSDLSDVKQMREKMKDVERKSGMLAWSFSVKHLKSEEDRRIYEQYLKNLFDTRDQRVMKILKDSFQKDLEVRKINLSAPLIHLVTLEGYEKAIRRQRHILYTKITLVACTVFFLQRHALPYLSRNHKFKLISYLFSPNRKKNAKDKGVVSRILSTFSYTYPYTLGTALVVLKLLFQRARPSSSLYMKWVYEFTKEYAIKM